MTALPGRRSASSKPNGTGLPSATSSGRSSHDLVRTLSLAQVAILTCAQDTADLRKLLGVQRVRIARRPGDDGVTVLPAREFRGCEAPAVLLVAGPEHDCADETRPRTTTSP